MKFTETPLRGAWLVDIEPISDERGFFARSFCAEAFAARGLEVNVTQCNVSHNRRRGTLRGMHFQAAPHEEAKLVRCTRGRIHDVILDLRRDSPAFGRWWGVELSAENRTALYVPRGLAHGFLTLEDDTEVLYQMSAFFHPESARGIRHDDPAFSIAWPEQVAVISEKDASYPDFAGDIA